MRIALFSGNYNYLREGANQALNRLVSYLETEAGHQVRVYSPVTKTPAFEPAGTLVPVQSISLPVRREFRLALGLPSAIRRNIREFAPDVVHVSTPDILNTRAQTFAKRLGVPIVASLHTRFETYLDFYGLRWSRPSVEAHLRRFYRRSDHVLAPTPSLVTEIAAMRNDHRVSLWSRGVDVSLFDPTRRDEQWRQSRGWSADDIVVLFFGRLVLEKGVEAFAAVVSELQGRGIRIKPLIVGAGPAAGAFSSLSDLVMCGHLEGEELARAIASADILLHASVTEAFGNVVLEAMASGLAVISADTPSASALVRHGRTGLLCPAADLASFAAAVSSLAASARGRKMLGARARAASLAYSWESASQSVEEAYGKLLNELGHCASRVR